MPLVLAMGLGSGNATSAVEGFGILRPAAIESIISVLLAGQWARFRAAMQIKAANSERDSGNDIEARALT